MAALPRCDPIDLFTYERGFAVRCASTRFQPRILPHYMYNSNSRLSNSWNRMPRQNWDPHHNRIHSLPAMGGFFYALTNIGGTSKIEPQNPFNLH